MFRRNTLLSLAIMLGLGVLTACGMLSTEKSFAGTHPQELGAGRPQCSSCHEDELKGAAKTYASFNHSSTFVKDHKVQSGQDGNVCATCHAQSFCSDCHAGKTVMKPSTKLGDRPDRATPHSGNYLTMHRIEGKIDPTSCYKCHGRANNDKCTACHR
ncbi:MAG: cytochrome C [Holophaga sp.]|nr:cytochrome C [Holophaga sp.]